MPGLIGEHLAATLARLGAAFALAAVPGVMLGLWMGMNPWVRRLADPYVSLLYPLPKIALLPLAMILLGVGEASFVATGAVTAFLQIAVSTMVGVRAIDRLLVDVGLNYGAERWRLYTVILLPASLPAIWTGLRLGLGLALILVVTIEFVAAKSGLGHLVWRYWQTLQLGEMTASLVLVGLLGIVVTHGLMWVGRRLMPWADL